MDKEELDFKKNTEIEEGFSDCIIEDGTLTDHGYGIDREAVLRMLQAQMKYELHG